DRVRLVLLVEEPQLPAELPLGGSHGRQRGPVLRLRRRLLAVERVQAGVEPAAERVELEDGGARSALQVGALLAQNRHSGTARGARRRDPSEKEESGEREERSAGQTMHTPPHGRRTLPHRFRPGGQKRSDSGGFSARSGSPSRLPASGTVGRVLIP